MTSVRPLTPVQLEGTPSLETPRRADLLTTPSDDARAQSPRIDGSPVVDRTLAPSRLRTLLVGIDVLGAVAAWTAAVVLLHPADASEAGLARRLGVASALVVVTIALVAREHLYLSRVCQVRAHELRGLVRVGTMGALAALVIGEAVGVALHPKTALFGGICVVVALAVLRGGYRAWIRARRAHGHCTRDIVVVGTNEEALELVGLFTQQPEIGYRVEGVFGDEAEWGAQGTSVAWLGPTDAAPSALRRSGAGAVVVTGGLPSAVLNQLVHDLVDQHTHVLMSSGIRNVGLGRLRALPLCHEPFFYVEDHSPSRRQTVAKRAFDLVTAGVLFVLTLPVVLCAAVAIKLCDRGPVLFRQQRVGLGGRSFEVLKLRTMVPDASEQLGALTLRNERRDGPLFKVTDDPRVTRVGRFLRASSIDELPQLVNVLRGEMSLVGPRPALPAEVAAFDRELLARLNVRPGITGLWQLEARDNPSFHVYRRLDLFYVENWSIVLDAAIVWSTAVSIVGRLVTAIGVLLSRRRGIVRRSARARTDPVA